MPKHTHGFLTGTDKQEAIKVALSEAVNFGLVSGYHDYTTEILETEDHKANGEFVVVVRWEDRTNG